MKKLLILILVILAMQVQGQTVSYYPTYTDSYAKVPGQEVATLIAVPDGYAAAMHINPTKKWPFMIFVHGKGQLGPGTKSALSNAYAGPFEAVCADWRSAINKYGIIGVVVNYNNQVFSPANWQWVINFVKSKYSLVDKPMGAGFSWGGGSIQKFYCTSLDYASLLAVAIPIAPTIELNSGWENVGKASLPVWIHVNKGDDVTGAAAAKYSVNYINALNPPIPATYTEYDSSGHGGTRTVLSQTPPPGYSENVYEWYLDVLKNGPRAPKKGTPTTPPPVIQPPTTSGPVIVREPLAAITTTGTVNLIACRSTGADYINWTVISVPKGASLYSPYINGAGNCTTSARFTVEGAYGIKTTACKAQTCVSDTFYVTYQKTTIPVPVVPYMYDSATGYLVFSDGTRVKATVTVEWPAKKVIVKDEFGIIYTL